MGTYCTTTSLEVLMIGTTFDSITTSLANKMITHAENEVNKYLSKRYDIGALALSVPPIVTSWTETLAEGYMYKRMSRGGKDATKRGQDLIDGVLKNLEQVSKYELDLIDGNGDLVSDMSNTAYRVLCNTSNYHPTFNEDDPLDWSIDQDKLDDIADERD